MKKGCFLIALAMLTAILVSGCPRSGVNAPSQTTTSLSTTATTAAVTTTAVPTYESLPDEKTEETVYVKGLPDLMDINKEKTPMLYDFENSSLGYQLCEDGYDFNNFGYYYAILQNSNDPNVIYVEYYVYGSVQDRPILGRAPILYNLSSTEIEAWETASSEVSKDRKIKEGDWTLYIISQYGYYPDAKEYDHCDAIGLWIGIDFLQFNESENGQMYNLVHGGLGWPTEWLRNEIYVDILKEDGGIDVFNDFWDRYNIDSYKIYKNKNNDTELKVTVTQIDCFEFLYGDQEVNLQEEELEEYLDLQGWE